MTRQTLGRLLVLVVSIVLLLVVCDHAGFRIIPGGDSTTGRVIRT